MKIQKIKEEKMEIQKKINVKSIMTLFKYWDMKLRIA